MRSLRLLALVTLIAAGCASSPSSPSSSSTTPPTPAPSSTAAAGNSCEDAVTIHGKNEDEGIKNENVWIREHFGGFKKAGQSLMHCNDKAVDEIDFVTADGQKHSIYFDISEWFGKW